MVKFTRIILVCLAVAAFGALCFRFGAGAYEQREAIGLFQEQAEVKLPKWSAIESERSFEFCYSLRLSYDEYPEAMEKKLNARSVEEVDDLVLFARYGVDRQMFSDKDFVRTLKFASGRGSKYIWAAAFSHSKNTVWLIVGFPEAVAAK